MRFERIEQRNPNLIRAAFELHAAGAVTTATYVLVNELDTAFQPLPLAATRSRIDAVMAERYSAHAVR
jgi:hypothetical protein